jgi:hypothetical protein
MEKLIESLVFEKSTNLLVEAETKWFDHKVRIFFKEYRVITL